MKSLMILLMGIGIWSLGLIWPEILSRLFSWPALIVLVAGWSLSELFFGLKSRSGQRPKSGRDGSGPQQPTTPVPVVQPQ